MNCSKLNHTTDDNMLLKIKNLLSIKYSLYQKLFQTKTVEPKEVNISMLSINFLHDQLSLKELEVVKTPDVNKLQDILD
jgi:hypothetical protein